MLFLWVWEGRRRGGKEVVQFVMIFLNVCFIGGVFCFLDF